MRLVVVFAVILELQRFWVFADPKLSNKEPSTDTHSQRMYKVQPYQAWVAPESRRGLEQRGFLPSSSYATRYQPRTPPVTEGRYRPQEYLQASGPSDYMPRREETRPTSFQRRPEIESQRHAQVVYRPKDSKYVNKNYKQYSASPSIYSRQEAHTQYHYPQTPQINSEGYQVVNEDPGLHTVVVSSSDQYSQPQVLTIRDNGQAYTSKASQYRSQGAAIAYEYPEVSRSNSRVQNVQSGSERRMSYSPQQDQQPEMHYRSRHSQQKSIPYVVSSADSSYRAAVLSNRQVMDMVNQ